MTCMGSCFIEVEEKDCDGNEYKRGFSCEHECEGCLHGGDCPKECDGCHDCAVCHGCYYVCEG